MNREAWLEAAVDKLRPIFLGKNHKVPEIRVSVGWPSSGGLGARKRTIGQCWCGTQAADGKPQVFISPLLDDPKDPMGVLATLVHEMVHTVVGVDAKHGPKFVKCMKDLGLAGKPTATHAGDDLIVRIGAIADELGAFPHSKLVPAQKPKTQTIRMRKCECEACGYLVRLTQKWADIGIPNCPVVGHGVLKLEMPKGGEHDDN